MVHTGRPSRGCEACRKRRIKCDEGQPGCSHCLRKQIPCPGYKSQFDVSWRDQNQVAEKSVQRRKNASESPKEKQQLQLFPSGVPKVLSQDTAGYALDFFFSFYICLPEDQFVPRAFLDCLYPVWVKTESTSPLRPIVTAVALVMLDAWSQLEPNQPFSLSRSQYAQGVAALRNRLQGGGIVDDEIIMAALMLNMYENLTSFLSSQQNKGPHMIGTTALIESRRKQPVADATSQKIVLGTRNQVITRALSNAEAVPSTISTWSEMTTDIPMTPSSRLDELNIRVANLQALATKLTHDNEVTKDLAASILKQATELDQLLSTWIDTLPTAWMPTRVSGSTCIPESVRSAGLYQEYCDIYKSVFVANTFNLYYSSRIKLQLTILACLKPLDSDPKNIQAATSLLVIQDLADIMCASIPFHLGDRATTGRIDDTNIHFPHAGVRLLPEGHHTSSAAFAGFFLCAFLAELLSPRVVLRAGQKQWIGGQLARIKRIYIIRAS